MALTPEEAAAVAALLEQQPGLSNSQVVKALGFGPTAQFSVAAVRRKLGMPEPPGAAKPGRKKGSRNRSGSGASSGGRRRASSAKSSASLDDLLEPEVAAPVAEQAAAPERRPKGPHSPLFIFKDNAVQGLTLWLYTQSGRADPRRGMSGDEALAVAAPAVRLADRNLAKYVKISGPVNENLKDLGAILGALAMWILRLWL